MSAQSNEAYAKVVMGNLRGLSKKIMTRLVAEAYYKAMDVTKQDSGRAAYNWKLKIGSTDSFEKGDWYQAPRPDTVKLDYTRSKDTSQRYSVRSGHPVGYQGEKRGQSWELRKVVIERNLKNNFLEGFRPNADYTSTPLYKKLRAGQSGRATTVTLYNPLYSDAYQRYSDNAFSPKGSPAGEKIRSRIATVIAKAQAEFKAGHLK